MIEKEGKREKRRGKKGKIKEKKKKGGKKGSQYVPKTADFYFLAAGILYCH